ncbi:hypothetical protein CRYUN_Cryun17cG0148300 [Craigia yunnanensis]
MKEGFIPLNPKQRSLFPWCLPTSIMDSKPFTVWGLFSPAKVRPKENIPVCEEINISLELSFSLDYTSTADRGKEENYYEGNFEVVSTELRLGPDLWCIKKQLFESDLGKMSKLMLASELVESHIFSFWNADQLTRIKKWLSVSLSDCDTKTEHEQVFKQWNKGPMCLSRIGSRAL